MDKTYPDYATRIVREEYKGWLTPEEFGVWVAPDWGPTHDHDIVMARGHGVVGPRPRRYRGRERPLARAAAAIAARKLLLGTAHHAPRAMARGRAPRGPVPGAELRCLWMAVGLWCCLNG